MRMVFITKHNFKLISKSLGEKITKSKREVYIKKLSENIDRELLEIFNDNQLRELYYEKNIFQNFNSLLYDIGDTYNMVSNYIEKSNKKNAYNIKKPSYHITLKCQFLHSNFKNIQVPIHIQNNTLKLNEFKEWINEYKNKPFKEINEAYKIKFNTNEDLKEINLKNSGYIKIDSNNPLEEIKEYMDNMPEEIKKIKFIPFESFNRVLKGTKSKEEYQKIEKFRDIKQSIYDLIFKIHQEKYGNID